MSLVVVCRKKGRSSKYTLLFPYNQQLVDLIKSLPFENRKFEKPYWVLTTSALWYIINCFKGSDKIKFDFGEEREKFIQDVKLMQEKQNASVQACENLAKLKEEWIEFKSELELNPAKYRELAQKGLKNGVNLFDHQIIGTMFIDKIKSGLLALDMGLGKTLISIAYVELHPEFEKVIVITPNSLKFNYYNEVTKFTNSKAHIIGWKKNIHSIDESKYIITNYEWFNPSDKKKFHNKYKNLGINVIDALILDECQRIKNTDSNTYKNLTKTFTSNVFRNNLRSFIGMSGTPAPNRAYELYAVLHEISPLEFTTKNKFYEKFCGITYDYMYGYNFDISLAKFEELFHKISAFTYRRLKKDVLDLPEKLYQNIIVEFESDEQRTYNAIEDGVVNDFVSVEQTNPLGRLTKLRQYTCSIKVKHLKEFIDTLIESGEKVVIIDVFKDSLTELKKIYGDIAVLHIGDVSPELRNDMVSDFQNPNGKSKVFLGTIATCNYGLTLTAASNIFIPTLPFSVGEFEQAADRIHRIGQRNNVTIRTLIFKDSIDEVVFNTLEDKRSELSQVMDNKIYQSAVMTSVYNEVLNKIVNKHGAKV